MIHAHLSFAGIALLGAVLWVSVGIYFHPLPTQVEWADLLLLLAALVLVPLGIECTACRMHDPTEAKFLRLIEMLCLPGATALVLAFRLPPGINAALLAGCWWLVTLLVAATGAWRLWKHTPHSVAELCISLGMIYLSIGGGWAVLSRAGLQPLDFEPAIVLLTAIHFHYAGFLLPLLTGLAIRRQNDFVARGAGIGAVAGVPLVAVGITATQLGMEPWLECAAAWITAIAGLFTAFLFWRLSRDVGFPRVARSLWIVSAASLAFGMILAAMYGTRFYLELAWLDIPWMRALHGTANAIGFALCGMVGWLIANRELSQ